ncbi:MAG: N-6 DNA methylase [Chloroflexota bacterium]|nr:N-6 DNA methylase [Chloroflexota bacterium]
MRRKAPDAAQTTLNGFMPRVEQATAVLERTAAAEPRSIEDFIAQPNPGLAAQVGERIGAIWDKIYPNAKIREFTDIVLAVIERREDDYMALIEGVHLERLQGYSQMLGELIGFFMYGNYGDPLGEFYMSRISYGKGGEYFTPFNVAYMMAKILNPKPGDVTLDPCCGTGVMLIASRCVIHQKHGWVEASQYGRNLYGIDINADIVGLAKVNMYLTDYVLMMVLLTDHAFKFMNKDAQ